MFWVMVSRVWFPCQRLLVSSFWFLVSYFLDLIPVSGFQILVNLFPVSGFPFLGLKLVGSQVAVSSFWCLVSGLLFLVFGFMFPGLGFCVWFLVSGFRLLVYYFGFCLLVLWFL